MKTIALTAVFISAMVSFGYPASDESDLKYWLENMIWYHNYTLDEMAKATKLPKEEIEKRIKRYRITRADRPRPKPTDPILVLPYPGGRHPRIGFLEGARNPMRGTKFSVFLPWRTGGYIVVDLPEAVWTNLGLTFLAHTHIPTIWDKAGIKLRDIDWTRKSGGELEERRVLPNGIVLATRVLPRRRFVDMEFRLKNGTSRTLSNIRVQICVMLKGAPDFDALTNANKIMVDELAAVRSKDGRRWIGAAWDYGKPWANPQVPCMHSDPHFPGELAPGAEAVARGRIFFYEGSDIKGEIERLRENNLLHWGP